MTCDHKVLLHYWGGVCVCVISPFMCILDLRRQKACIMHCAFILKIYMLHKGYTALLFPSATVEPVWKEPDKMDNYIPPQFHLPYGTLSFAIRRRQWQPTPVGCHLWGRTESDTTKATQQQQQHEPLPSLPSVLVSLVSHRGFFHLSVCS